MLIDVVVKIVATKANKPTKIEPWPLTMKPDSKIELLAGFFYEAA